MLRIGVATQRERRAIHFVLGTDSEFLKTHTLFVFFMICESVQSARQGIYVERFSFLSAGPYDMIIPMTLPLAILAQAFSGSNLNCERRNLVVAGSLSSEDTENK